MRASEPPYARRHGVLSIGLGRTYISSPTRTRTLDIAVNSRSLYQLSYRGIVRFRWSWNAEVQESRLSLALAPESGQGPTILYANSYRPDWQGRPGGQEDWDSGSGKLGIQETRREKTGNRR